MAISFDRCLRVPIPKLVGQDQPRLGPSDDHRLVATLSLVGRQSFHPSGECWAGNLRIRGKPRALSSERPIEDLACLATGILARAPRSQGELGALPQRYQKAPPPDRGKKADGCYRMRLLAMDLAEDRPRLTLNDTYCEADGRRFPPTTNNGSEQRIGYSIMERYRTMRGCKRTASLPQVPALTAHLREANDPRVLVTLFAD